MRFKDCRISDVCGSRVVVWTGAWCIVEELQQVCMRQREAGVLFSLPVDDSTIMYGQHMSASPVHMLVTPHLIAKS